jgi:hypothetical protein
LWVDTLCILQDDADDWEREAAQMDQVYGNADLVIAATSAENVQKGFLQQERRHPQGSVYFHDKVDSSKIYAIKYGLGPKYEMTLEEGPLAERAWAYQEKMLARRYLSFGPEELSWHCNAIETCECSFGNPSEHFRQDHRSGWGGPAGEDDMKISRIISPEKSTADIYMTWISRIVPTYTGMKLSRPSDRIVAISSVASRLAQRLEDRLTYGLWTNRMVEQLGWYTYLPKKCVVGVPTWSWASVEDDNGCLKYDAEAYRARASPKYYPEFLGLRSVEGGRDQMCCMRGKFFEASLRLEAGRHATKNLSKAVLRYEGRVVDYHSDLGHEHFGNGELHLDAPLVAVKAASSHDGSEVTTLRDDRTDLLRTRARPINEGEWSQVWCMPYCSIRAVPRVQIGRPYRAARPKWPPSVSTMHLSGVREGNTAHGNDCDNENDSGIENEGEVDYDSDNDPPYAAIRHKFMLLGESIRYPGAFERLGFMTLSELPESKEKSMTVFLRDAPQCEIRIA